MCCRQPHGAFHHVFPPEPVNRTSAVGNSESGSFSCSETLAPTLALSGHSGDITGVSINHKITSIAYTASYDGSLRSWDLDSGTCARTHDVGGQVLSMASSGRHAVLAVGGREVRNGRWRRLGSLLNEVQFHSVLGCIDSPESRLSFPRRQAVCMFSCSPGARAGKTE